MLLRFAKIAATSANVTANGRHWPLITRVFLGMAKVFLAWPLIQ